MIAPYNENYLDDAMDNLGEAFDYAVLACGLDIDDFAARFVAGQYAAQFERGLPRVIAGMSGTELAMRVIRESGDMRELPAPRTAAECSSEYWTGWIAAYAQWQFGICFADIFACFAASDIRAMYTPLHEAPESKFAALLREAMQRKSRPLRLQILRRSIGMTQAELAAAAGVSLRTLQSYESGKLDVNKASGSTLLALSRALGCRMEDLLQPELGERSGDA